MQTHTNPEKKEAVTVIGAAILDILAGPVSADVFRIGSQPMKQIRMSFGGDALNETLVLNRLGKEVGLLSKIGNDEGGRKILEHLKACGISTDGIVIEDGLETGINIVLIDEKGERHFLTNPESSLRKLSEDDLMPFLDQAADIVSFASIFVSPVLDLSAMERIFARIKSVPGRRLVLDMTKPKKGECLEDLQTLLPYVDYMLPNQDEIAMLTGETDPVKNARLLTAAGVSHAVIKTGAEGCILCTGDEVQKISAYPGVTSVDSTGAGDCFAAGFLYALSEGWPAEDCCRFACAAASCTVEHVGATEGIRSLEQIMERYRSM